MAVESLLAALPLLAFGALLSAPVSAAAVGAIGAGDGAPTPDRRWRELPRRPNRDLIGAGLYEELFFRMILLAALHTLLVNVAGLPNKAGSIIAILLSALAFTGYHDLTAPPTASTGSRRRSSSSPESGSVA